MASSHSPIVNAMLQLQIAPWVHPCFSSITFGDTIRTRDCLHPCSNSQHYGAGKLLLTVRCSYVVSCNSHYFKYNYSPICSRDVKVSRPLFALGLSLGLGFMKYSSLSLICFGLVVSTIYWLYSVHTHIWSLWNFTSEKIVILIDYLSVISNI